MKQDFRENLALAFDTLRTHKLRSFLAVLGVMIGVALIILVVGFVQGFRLSIQDEITQEGLDTAWVQRFNRGLRQRRPSPKRGARAQGSDARRRRSDFAVVPGGEGRRNIRYSNGNRRTACATRKMKSRASNFAARSPRSSRCTRTRR